MLKPADELPLEHARCIRFGDCEVDLGNRTLLRRGKDIHLQPKAFVLLETLLLRSGQVLTKDELLAQVWPGQVVTDHALTRAIKALRQALDDDAQNPRYIETVPRVGYRFIAEADTALRDRKTAARLPLRWIIALAVTIAAIIGLWLSLGRPPEGRGPDLDADPRTDTVALNADRFEAQGWQMLSQRGRGLILARDSFQNALDEDPRHARAMVGLALTIMVAHSGERMSEQWESEVQRLLSQAAAIQPDLGRLEAARGLQALRESRYPAAETHLRRAIELDPDFAESYSWLSSVLHSRGMLDESIQVRRQALKLDPLNATLTGNLAMSLAASGRFEEAQELIESHEQLPGGIEPMVYPQAIILINRGQLAAVGDLYRQLLTRYPESNYGREALAQLLLQLGRPDIVADMLDEGADLCLGPARRFSARSGLLEATGNFRELARWAEQQRDAGGPDEGIAGLMGLAAFRQDRYQEAIDLLGPDYLDQMQVAVDRGNLLTTTNEVHVLAAALIKRGSAEAAESLLVSIDDALAARERGGYRNYPPYLLLRARNEALLGRTESALDALQAAVSHGWLHANVLNRDPLWHGISGEPRFVQIVQEVERRIAAQNAVLADNGFDDWLGQYVDAISGCTEE